MAQMTYTEPEPIFDKPFFSFSGKTLYLRFAVDIVRAIRYVARIANVAPDTACAQHLAYQIDATRTDHRKRSTDCPFCHFEFNARH